MIFFICGDIVKEAGNFDAIVNAGNNGLSGDAGVEGAIRKAGGPELVRKMSGLNSCKTGRAKLTKAYQLPCKAIIHTVGPDIKKYKSLSPIYLKIAYKSCLKLAKKHKLYSIAFPSISTGSYGYPIEKAARTAVKTVLKFLEKYPEFDITWVLYTEEDYDIYLKQFKALYHHNY